MKMTQGQYKGWAISKIPFHHIEWIHSLGDEYRAPAEVRADLEAEYWRRIYAKETKAMSSETVAVGFTNEATEFIAVKSDLGIFTYVRSKE